MARDGFSCFLGIQNFPGEHPRTPFKISKYVIYFSIQHYSHTSHLVKNEVFN